MHVNRKAGRDKETVAEFFNDAIDAREEGIIVKISNSHYQVRSSSLSFYFALIAFCLDEISFRRDYKSCRIGVVV